MPASLTVCGDPTSPTGDGVPAPPQQPYDQRAVAVYILQLKAIIRECHGNNKAALDLLDTFQTRFAEMEKASR